MNMSASTLGVQNPRICRDVVCFFQAFSQVRLCYYKVSLDHVR